MFKPATHWNPVQAELRAAIRQPEHFGQAMQLCAQLHSLVHLGELYGGNSPTLADEVKQGLPEAHYALMPTSKDVTIAWNLWHTTRIEDATMNLLVAAGSQVLNADWLEKLGTAVTDTGNAMTDEEIISLSNTLNKTVLWQYRTAVGQRSREIIRQLAPSDMSRTFSPQQVNLLLTESVLTQHPDSFWLQSFWGRKDVAGILLLPLTRHQAGHLNDCLKLKKKCQRVSR